METKVKRIVPIDVIKKCVSQASKVRIEDIDLSNKDPLSRKREIVTARQISMTLSKTYTKSSLTVIGFHHGRHDHATVMHSCQVIQDLLDTKDPEVTEYFKESDRQIQMWCKRNNPWIPPIPISADRVRLIKHWIKCHVPLYVRQEYLQSIGKKCPVCGSSLCKVNYYGNRIKTVPDSL